MIFFRNPEVKKQFLLYFLFTVGSSVITALYDPSAGGIVLAVCGVSALLFGVFTQRRYHEISNLSERLDQILHGVKTSTITPDKEGELAVLSSEISKLVVRLQEQTEQLQKDKKYLSDSIADISHQIKTPLTSIRMVLPRLRREELTPQQKSEYVQEINRLLSRMEWLITILLKIARLESGTVQFEKKPIKVSSLIEEVIHPLEIVMEVKEITAHISVDENAQFEGDFLWTVEAVANIMKNCIEHLPKSGTLWISAIENPIYTEIFISDSGDGIASEDLPHLFERFYKGKNAKTENAGIGLALSQMILARQNGIIKVENLSPNGAGFHIRFYKGAV